MPIDWKTQESYQRLLGALVAASDNSIDYKKVAYYFGQGATYDAIEGRFRIAKRAAADLKREAEEEGRQMPASRVRSATSTPRKPKAPKPSSALANDAAGAESSQHSVQSGRVQKSTPSKAKRKGKQPTTTVAAAAAAAAAVTSPTTVKQEPQTPISISDDGADEDSDQWAATHRAFETAFTHSFDDAALQRSFFDDAAV